MNRAEKDIMARVLDERRKEMKFDIPEEKYNEEHVDHPSHYNRVGAKECIDEMILVFGKRAVSSFCLLNAWKYRYRAADKNGLEDIKKSDWYLAKYEELGGGKDRDPWGGPV